MRVLSIRLWLAVVRLFSTWLPHVCPCQRLCRFGQARTESRCVRSLTVWRALAVIIISGRRRLFHVVEAVNPTRDVQQLQESARVSRRCRWWLSRWLVDRALRSERVAHGRRLCVRAATSMCLQAFCAASSAPFNRQTKSWRIMGIHPASTAINFRPILDMQALIRAAAGYKSVRLLVVLARLARWLDNNNVCFVVCVLIGGWAGDVRTPSDLYE